MSRRAWAYVWLVFLGGALAIGLALPRAAVTNAQLPTFLALTAFATLAQLYKVEAPGRQSYHTSLIFVFAALILLPPILLIALIAISLLAEWAKERLMDSDLLRNWYLQPFNISTLVLTALAARWLYDSVLETPIAGVSIPSWFPAVLASAASFVLINHLLVGLALVLARGISWRHSGILDAEILVTEVILLCLGFVVASLWSINLWLIPLALSPLVLMHQALKIPLLKHEAQTDPKTGLWNARHFVRLFTTELERARRFDRPLALIMADLDLLRNINNTYGHLAGDAVLAEMGQIIRKAIRGYDIPARFGGEEFTIALPETGAIEAKNIAERLRRAVETFEFRVTNNQTPVRVTMSLGVALHPTDALTAAGLVHAADVAVLQAKLQGRNCTICASDVPDVVKSTYDGDDERLIYPHEATFVPRPPCQPSPRDTTPIASGS
jgi:diguanylate cyclase (GGDEF)-like protein